VVTGIILALSLPAAIPFWAAIIGSVFAIAIAKMVFGGLGSNIFNPAMAARAFLAVSFGMLMTTWTVPATIGSTDMTLSATSNTPITQATPLAWSKEAIKEKAKADVANNMLKESFFGGVGGCLGETSAVALLIGGAYLLIRKTIALHIPLAVLLSGFAFAAIAYFINSEKFVSPLLHLTTGGMLLCVFFIATDPVTAPLSSKGMWIFGAGLGALIMLIRIVGEYPEGVMFAVLIMNAVAPLIDRFCKIIPAGGVIANE
jgi:electron transport complex protein RnfD